MTPLFKYGFEIIYKFQKFESNKALGFWGFGVLGFWVRVRVRDVEGGQQAGAAVELHDSLALELLAVGAVDVHVRDRGCITCVHACECARRCVRWCVRMSVCV